MNYKTFTLVALFGGITTRADSLETAIEPSCKLIDGYDMVSGCKSSIVEELPKCTDADSVESCIDELDDVSTQTNYLKMISSSNTRKSFWSSVTKAEGGGWGVKVSTSASVMESS